MVFSAVPMLLASLLLVATSILFYSGIRKNGVEKPNWVDRLSLAIATVTALSINRYDCFEGGCISGGIPVLIVALPVVLACLAFPPGSRGRASFAHRIACVVVCFAAGFLAALVSKMI